MILVNAKVSFMKSGLVIVAALMILPLANNKTLTTYSYLTVNK
jgi:hypothetical protein